MRVKYLKSTIRQHFPNFNKRFVQIGSGVQGVVYSDGDFAYKLCRFNTNYVKWLLDLRRKKLIGNPHIPEVYEIYVDKHKKDCLVRMELLSSDEDDIMWDESIRFEEKFSQFEKKKTKKARLSNYDKVVVHLVDFISRKKKAGKKICLDMHSGNVMYRYNQIVITDPVV